jgi:hypothetical protein
MCYTSRYDDNSIDVITTAGLVFFPLFVTTSQAMQGYESGLVVISRVVFADRFTAKARSVAGYYITRTP